MTLHRKIGGIHWFAIGRLRISFCIVRKHHMPRLPRALTLEEYNAKHRPTILHTWSPNEHNHFIF
jgi:hypothetical protein